MKISVFVNYLISLCFALVVALYMSGRIGWFIVLVFVGAPVISLLMTLPFIRHIRVSGSVDSRLIAKGDVCRIEINVGNSFFLPSPPVVLEVFNSERVSCGESEIYVSVMPKSQESFSADFKGIISGRAEIGIKSVKLKDYLGVFSFSLKNADVAALCGMVDIIPDIADISADNPVLAQIAQAAADADSSEDTAENGVATFGGFPGYDSREYVPSDPLKRINWKLSAKRNNLLVRLDEEMAEISVDVVIDRAYVTDSGERSPIAEQAAVENALGITRLLINIGYDVNFFAYGGSGWEKYHPTRESGLTELCIALAGYTFAGDNAVERIPEYTDGGSAVLLCTPYADGYLKSLCDAKGGKTGLNIVLYPSEKGSDDA